MNVALIIKMSQEATGRLYTRCNELELERNELAALIGEFRKLADIEDDMQLQHTLIDVMEMSPSEALAKSKLK